MASTLYSQALNANNASWNGVTVVMRFETAALTMPSGNISQVRVRFEAASVTEGLIITNAYIGHAAGSGDAYDFDTTPVQLLFSGAANVSIGVGATATSDYASFVYNETSPLLISFYVGGGTGQDSMRERTGMGANIIRYHKTANDAATVNKTGYTTTSGTLAAINLIEVETAISIIAGHGSFTLTGQSASLLYGRQVTAAQGSFTLTGQSASLLYGRLLTAAYGAFVLTGQAITTTVFRLLKSIYVLADDLVKAVKGTDTGNLNVDEVDYSKLTKGVS